jgi:hypothetical protein
MSDEKKAFSIDIEEGDSTYHKFYDDDFKSAQERAEEFVEKGTNFSALIYDKEDLVELIKWDENLDQIVYILTSYGSYKGYEIVEPK